MLGTVLLIYRESWARKNSLYLVSFAAGVMLATSFLNLIPEALSLSKAVPWAALAGILVFYFFQQVINLHPCHDEDCRLHNMGMLSFAGLAFHSLLDGIAIALGFEIGVGIGIMTTLAVLLHEFPEGITITSILMYTKMKKKKIILYSFLVASATPVGAILFYPFLERLSEGILGLALAFAAGSFIYIAASDLIPQTHKAQNRLNGIILFLGVIFVALMNLFINH